MKTIRMLLQIGGQMINGFFFVTLNRVLLQKKRPMSQILFITAVNFCKSFDEKYLLMLERIKREKVAWIE